MNFKDKLKKFFSDKINTAMVVLTTLLVVMLIIPCNNDWYIRVLLWMLSADMLLLGYKMYKKHKSNTELYEVIDATTQSENNNVFGRVSNKIRSIDRKSYLMYAICFFVLAVVIVVYTIIN